MGYNTDYHGQIEITPPITQELADYINKFSSTRRMKRSISDLQNRYNSQYGFQNSYGTDGGWFVGDDEKTGVVDYNRPPSTQPGLWCQWIITDDKEHIEWDQNEKFYDGEAWMKYIIDNFLAPLGYKCNGTIEAVGEDSDDRWELIVTDNVVTTANLSPADLKDEIIKRDDAIESAKNYIEGYIKGVTKVTNGEKLAIIRVENVFSFLNGLKEKLEIK